MPRNRSCPSLPERFGETDGRAIVGKAPIYGENVRLSYQTMQRNEPQLTTLSRKGQIVIPQALRKRLGIVPNTRFLVYGEGDTVLLRRLNLPDVRREWKSINDAVERKMAKYGPIDDEEITATARKYRHRKRQGS